MTFGKVVMKLRDAIFSSVNKMSIKASRLPDFHPGGTKNLGLETFSYRAYFLRTGCSLQASRAHRGIISSLWKGFCF
jgi:hypothetical protein